MGEGLLLQLVPDVIPTVEATGISVQLPNPSSTRKLPQKTPPMQYLSPKILRNRLPHIR